MSDEFVDIDEVKKAAAALSREEYVNIQNEELKKIDIYTDIYTPYLNLDSTVTKTVTNENGTTANFACSIPRFNALNFKPVSVSWTIISVHSNFKNSVKYSSNAEASWKGEDGDLYTDANFPILDVKKIQNGEVVFVEILCEMMSDKDIYVFNTCTHSFYRGDPINTSFRIYYPKNGKLASEIIYDNPIEGQLISANEGKRIGARLGDTVQSNRQNISEYLSEYAENVESLSNVDTSANRKQTKTINGQKKKVQTEVWSFVKEENVFYAHGRSLDMKSISSLLYQNPANFFYKNSELKPNKGLLSKAMKNRLAQHPGYNSFLIPLPNPYLPTKTQRFYFPGRSGHTASNTGGNCGNTCSNDGSQGPTYEGQTQLANNSQTPTSQSFCGNNDCC